jgi:hypothetical protein
MHGSQDRPTMLSREWEYIDGPHSLGVGAGYKLSAPFGA